MSTYQKARGRFRSPVLRVLIVPFLRFSPEELPAAAKAAAFLAVMLQVIWQDISGVIIGLLLLSGVADTIYGRRLHHALGTFEQARAELGLQTKIMGIVLCSLIRGFEWWWEHRVVADSDFSALHTHGWIAAAAATALFVSDLKSIEEKLERMSRPMPFLAKVLAVLDKFGDILLLPADKKTEIKRRHDDNAGG